LIGYWATTAILVVAKEGSKFIEALSGGWPHILASLKSPSMAGDVSLAGHWIARVAAGSVVKMCLAPAMSILWDARKNFGKCRNAQSPNVSTMRPRRFPARYQTKTK